MNWFKSRYTASLEQRIEELKEELSERKQAILDLYDTMAELRLQLAGRPATSVDKTKAADKNKPEPPRAVNWLQARGSLESTNHEITEAEPKETTANGSR